MLTVPELCWGILSSVSSLSAVRTQVGRPYLIGRGCSGHSLGKEMHPVGNEAPVKGGLFFIQLFETHSMLKVNKNPTTGTLKLPLKMFALNKLTLKRFITNYHNYVTMAI